MPFSDLQGILNAQFHTVSDLLTIIFLCLRILSYRRAICWYSDLIDLARSTPNQNQTTPKGSVSFMHTKSKVIDCDGKDFNSNTADDAPIIIKG